MKKYKLANILTMALIFSFAFSFNSENAIAKSRGKERQKPKEKIQAEKKSAAQDERALLEKIKKSLNNTEWQIQLREISASEKKKIFKDTLHFSNDRIGSVALSKEGFIPTSYTLSLKGENIFVWETMQTDADNNLALWKGEIENDLMRGVLSRRKEGMFTGEDYSFVSTAKEALPVDESIFEQERIDKDLAAQADLKAKIEEEKPGGEKNVKKKFLFW